MLSIRTHRHNKKILFFNQITRAYPHRFQSFLRYLNLKIRILNTMQQALFTHRVVRFRNDVYPQLWSDMHGATPYYTIQMQALDRCSHEIVLTDILHLCVRSIVFRLGFFLFASFSFFCYFCGFENKIHCANWLGFVLESTLRLKKPQAFVICLTLTHTRL